VGKVLFVLAALAASAPAHAAQSREAPGLLDRAPADAAQALLGQVSRRFVTMVGEDDGVGLTPISFATAPESDLFAGLCHADVMHFLVELPTAPAVETTIWRFERAEVYRVVADVTAHQGNLRQAPEAQAALCANAGPVLPPQRGVDSGRRFFDYLGEEGPYTAVAALQGAIRRARQGRYGRVRCVRRSTLNGCRNPEAELGQLDLADLAWIELRPQGSDLLSFEYVLTARFIADPSEPVAGGQTLVIELSGGPFPLFGADFHYGRTELTR